MLRTLVFAFSIILTPAVAAAVQDAPEETSTETSETSKTEEKKAEPKKGDDKSNKSTFTY